ncbi:translation initiation factor IF-3 [bacterium]|nr:translation initiation factor IF-3 [bacterium]
MPAPQKPRRDRNKPEHRINEQIRCREVRIVGDDVESEVMPTRQAIQLAQQKGVDLVEISPNAEPPVCRLINYSKFLYQQKKRQKELKAKQVKIEVKEIRFGPQTDEHDYNFKLKHAKEFLSDGDKVKAYVFFRGRSILFKEQGEVLLLRFANDLEEYGKVEQMPVLEGKRMILFIAPKKSGGAKKAESHNETNETPAEESKIKKAPQVKAKKEYQGPRVEGEEF